MMKSNKLKVISDKYFSAYKNLIIFCILTFCFNIAKAQRFTATAEAKEVPLNYVFDVTYEISNANASDFSPPRFDNFDVVAGPSQSQNMTIVNGKMSKSVSITYTLKPKKQGEYTIGAATAIINGTSSNSNTIYVKITAPSKQPQQSQQGYDPFDAFRQMQQPQQENSESDVLKYAQKNIFIRVIPSKTTLYQGDQFSISYKLYFKLQVYALQALKMPDFNGFLSEEFKLPEPNPNEEPPIEVFEGKKYYVREFKRVSLFPTKSGRINIDPIELQSTIGIPQYHPFFGYVGDQQYDYNFKSNAITLDIKPLPEKNKPSTFSGAVGKFSFSAKYDKTKCKVGEPISLKVTYSGTGNFKLITAPKLVFPEEFEAYEPKIKDEYQNNGSIVTGSKTFEYIIVPQDGGKYKLPKYEFAYFDVDKADYVKFTLPETEIEVSGKAAISQNVVNFFKREKENVPKGMYGIKQQFVASNSFVGSNTFWLLTASPFLFLLIGFVFRNKEYSDSELLLLRRKKANAIALRRLATAKKLMQNKNEQAFYNEVIRALWEFLSDKLYIPQAQLSKENIAEKLTAKNVSQNKIDALNETLESCEQALFSPEIAQNKMPATFDKARELIIDFEEDLKSN
ncbi:MAG TPA: BatD family protein [Chitinophagales bacterium]|nr:BatD family protein [Chitinophagales bacterium]